MDHLLRKFTYGLLAAAVMVGFTSRSSAQDTNKRSEKGSIVLLDNEHARVLECSLAVSERTPMSPHPAAVLYTLSPCHVKIIFSDGRIRVADAEQGKAIWRSGETFAVENIGMKAAKVLIVEFKQPTLLNTTSEVVHELETIVATTQQSKSATAKAKESAKTEKSAKEHRWHHHAGYHQAKAHHGWHRFAGSRHAWAGHRHGKHVYTRHHAYASHHHVKHAYTRHHAWAGHHGYAKHHGYAGHHHGKHHFASHHAWHHRHGKHHFASQHPRHHHHSSAHHGKQVMFTPKDLKWSAEKSEQVPAGVQIAVLEGNPDEHAPFTIRVKLPAGFKVPSFMEKVRPEVTVLSGTLNIGTGEKFDKSKAKALPAGSFVHLGADKAHFVWTDQETVLQIHGRGPWDLHFVNPAEKFKKSTVED